MIPKLTIQLSADKQFEFPAIDVADRFAQAYQRALGDRDPATSTEGCAFNEVRIGQRTVFGWFKRINNKGA